MSNDGTPQPVPNLADILAALQKTAANQQSNTLNTFSNGNGQQQPWQPANEPWRPPQQNQWQPPAEQQRQHQAQNAWMSPQSQSHTPSPISQTAYPQHMTQQQPPQSYIPLPNPHRNKPAHLSQSQSQRQTQTPPIQQARLADTIITWPEGLKLILSLVHTHSSILTNIKALIKTQNDHETQWWSARQNLIMDHRKRVASHKLAFSKALADKAKAESEGRGSAGIGEGVLGVSEDDLEADLKTQLEVYDAKVYRAQLQMVKEFTLQLRSMGVPFFGTRMEYVVLPDKSAEGTPVEGGEKKPEEIQKVDGKVTEKELVELQRKMLELLESLCDAK